MARASGPPSCWQHAVGNKDWVARSPLSRRRAMTIFVIRFVQKPLSAILDHAIPVRLKSDSCSAAIDGELRAMDETRAVCREEHDRFSDLIGRR